MGIGIIALCVIGAYVLGDDKRKQKMRKLGSDITDVAMEVGIDTVNQAKHIIGKFMSERCDAEGCEEDGFTS